MTGLSLFVGVIPDCRTSDKSGIHNHGLWLWIPGASLCSVPELHRSGFLSHSSQATYTVMSDFMSHVAVPIAIGAVAVVLLLGLINMMRGGSPNRSQQLMRLRVLLQFVAIVIIMFTLWIMAK
jgi:hypothetical protein